MAITSQLRPNPGLGDAWISHWQEAGLLKPSVVKPVFATLEQRLVLRRLGAFDDDDLVLRVIHTIHQAMARHHSYQSRYTGESRCPRQKWIPAFAGKARRGRRAASTE
jgi:hypothetical protein